MRHTVIALLILIITRFLDKIAAQHLYLLAVEHELLTANNLSLKDMNHFYTLKGFWNVLWWVLLVASFLGLLFGKGGLITLPSDISNYEEEEKDDGDLEEIEVEPKPKPKSKSSSKRPRRPSKRYKSNRYKL